MVPRITLLIPLIILALAMECLGAEACLKCHKSHFSQYGRCIKCHHGNDRTYRKQLAHSGIINGRYASFTFADSDRNAAGIELTERFACRRCHILNSRGRNIASNLDRLLWNSTPEKIRQALSSPALYMPDFRFSEKELDLVVTSILAAGMNTGKPVTETPQVIHFANSGGNVGGNIFQKRCGGCHKLLSHRDGGLGTGDTGPNLTGIFSTYYKETTQEKRRWDTDRLRRWLKNPRDLRKNALMPPLAIGRKDFEELVTVMERD